MSRTAIVIGGTGLVGKALVDQLAVSDHIARVNNITRRSYDHPNLKIKNLVINFDEMEDHAEYFKGDLLFSCLGTTIKKAGSVAQQRLIDLEYQYRAAALAANNGTEHYLLVSSVGANADSSNPFLQMKGELEERVQALHFKRISIFQPSLLSGKREEFRFGEKIGSLTLPVLNIIPGLRRFRPIRGEQVAKKMVLVSQNEGPVLERFVLDDIFVMEN